MGLHDGTTDRVMDKTGEQEKLLTALVGLLASDKIGGITGLMEKFKGKGLGNLVNSWVGTGTSMSITVQQVEQGLGDANVRELASKAGISTDQVTTQLSKLLPDFVDKLTPDGQAPKGDLMSTGMDVLKGNI